MRDAKHRSPVRIVRGAPAALACLWISGCAPEPLPAPYARSSPEPCLAAPPAPALVLSRPTDPAQCFSTRRAERGASVFIEVDAKGRPIGIEQVYDLCLYVDGDGRQLEVVPLDDREKRCILDTVQAWRFAAFDTCARQGIVVDLPLPTDRRSWVGRERFEVEESECGGAAEAS